MPCGRCADVRAVVVVTSDKCYENRESAGGYREGDPLGGHDPYSSSKAAAELVTSAYRRSFFSPKDGPRVATARAGNVTGRRRLGEDRLIPDIARRRRPPEGQRRCERCGRHEGHEHAGGRGRLAGHRRAAAPAQPVRGPPVAARAVPALRLPVASPGFVQSRRPTRARGVLGPEKSDARTVEWVVRRVSRLWPGGVPWEIDEA